MMEKVSRQVTRAKMRKDAFARVTGLFPNVERSARRRLSRTYAVSLWTGDDNE